MSVPSHSDLQTSETMSGALKPSLPGFGSVQWLANTGSTNLDLVQRARQPARPALPWLLGADRQSTARGRAGRVWENTSGATLMFSCAFEVNLPPSELPGLSPVMGIAACEALRVLLAAYGDDEHDRKLAHRLQLKWPNDLLWDQAKLAGILVESTHMTGSRTPLIVIGIGLNLRDGATLSAQLNRPIADWSQIAEISPVQIVTHIARAWSDALSEYSTSGYAAFIKHFEHVDGLAGHRVDVTDQGCVLQTGTAMGTDSTGRLLIQTDQGMHAVMVGDVSIRPSMHTSSTADYS
ncbi:MAG: biotin--[acetyl-CoA-carboxylase] ligase [Sheuella sp.]|nr:biotin--[acetyl-CoA-carboxylase] ligase [Sheuella sp.]